MRIDDERKRFTELYERESGRLFRFCFIRVSDREKALDITQESFTRLWSSILAGKQAGPEHATPFLYRVAKNLIIDWYRRVKSLSLEGLTGDEETQFDPPDHKSAAMMELSSDAKRALESLSELESQFREVLYFRFVEDLPPKEIAEILGLNANIVSVRLTRGLAELRKVLKINKNEDGE